jgi:anti-anti-sigma factor
LATATPIQHSDENGVHIVSFHRDERGNASQDAVRQFLAHDFLQATAPWNHLVLDLAGVVSLDSAALGPMVQKLREVQEKKGKMALAGVASAALREIFALTRFDKVFAIYPSRAEAVKAIGVPKA